MIAMSTDDKVPHTLDRYEHYRAEHDAQLTEFAEKIEQARDVVDLRVAWMECPLVSASGAYVSTEAHTKFTQAIVETFARLGIDPEVEDERLDYLMHAFETVSPDGLGSYADDLYSPIMTGFYLIIAACDPTVEGKLELRQPQQLVEKAIPGLREIALEFTNGPDFASGNLIPVKARHTVTDPKSPYWGFGLSTNTYTGVGHEFVNVYMPTGLTTSSELIRTASSAQGPEFLPGGTDTFQEKLQSKVYI